MITVVYFEIFVTALLNKGLLHFTATSQKIESAKEKII